MTDLTSRQILDAIDRALEKTARQFAKSASGNKVQSDRGKRKGQGARGQMPGLTTTKRRQA